MTGPELREWRLARGLSQRQLAAYLGTTVTTVSRWECGVNPVPHLVGLALKQWDTEHSTSTNTDEEV